MNYAADLNMLISASFDEPGKYVFLFPLLALVILFFFFFCPCFLKWNFWFVRAIVFSVELPDMIIADFAVITHLEDPVPTQMTSNTETSIETRSGYR